MNARFGCAHEGGFQGSIPWRPTTAVHPEAFTPFTSAAISLGIRGARGKRLA